MNPELEHKVFTQRELYSFLYFILIFFIVSLLSFLAQVAIYIVAGPGT